MAVPSRASMHVSHIGHSEPHRPPSVSITTSSRRFSIPFLLATLVPIRNREELQMPIVRTVRMQLAAEYSPQLPLASMTASANGQTTRFFGFLSLCNSRSYGLGAHKRQRTGSSDNISSGTIGLCGGASNGTTSIRRILPSANSAISIRFSGTAHPLNGFHTRSGNFVFIVPRR